MTTQLNFDEGTIASEYATISCYSCGILFAVPASWREKRREDGNSFWCPNGHSQHYTESARQREEKLRRELQHWRNRVEGEERRLAAEKRSHAATKGQLTRAKKRAQAGVCLHCNRAFQNVARHMQNQHPNEVHDA